MTDDWQVVHSRSLTLLPFQHYFTWTKAAKALVQVNIQYTLDIFCTLRASHVQNVGQYNVKKKNQNVIAFWFFFSHLQFNKTPRCSRKSSRSYDKLLKIGLLSLLVYLHTYSFLGYKNCIWYHYGYFIHLDEACWSCSNISFSVYQWNKK